MAYRLVTAGAAFSGSRRNAIEAPAPSLLRQPIVDSWEHLWRERRRMSLFSLQPTAGPSVQREHVAIVSAIANRDAKGAAAAMATHRESTLAAWRKALAELPSLPHQ